MFRVGYWMSEKKIRKLNFTTYCDKLKGDHGIDMILLSLDKPLEQQGPFDVIIHKLTDVMAAADAGHERSESAVKRAEAYFASQPGLHVLDPLAAVRNLTDRDTCYSLMKACSKRIGDVEITSPNFATIHSCTVDKAATLRASNVSFPIVCKPIVAHGSDLAHKMAIIFNEDHLCDMQTPCVAQQFVNHSAVLHKVFVIGENYYIVERPSIKNLIAGDHDTIFFDSHDVSKATSDSYLNQMEKTSGLPTPDNEAIRWLVNRLRETMSLNLFGVDIIIENDTLRHVFIDVNFFPGYDGVADMFPAFTQLLKSHLHTGGSVPTNNSRPGVSSESADKHSTPHSLACTSNGDTRHHYPAVMTNGHGNGCDEAVTACNGTVTSSALPGDGRPLSAVSTSATASSSHTSSAGQYRETRPARHPVANGFASGDVVKAKRPCADYDPAPTGITCTATASTNIGGVVDTSKASTAATCNGGLVESNGSSTVSNLANGHFSSLHVVS